MLPPKTSVPLREKRLYIFTGGLGGAGGRFRATMTLSKAHCLCVPSQNCLLADCPQRQSDTLVRPPSPKTLPCESTISKSPSTLIDPLSLMVIFVAAIFSLSKAPASDSFSAASTWEPRDPLHPTRPEFRLSNST